MQTVCHCETNPSDSSPHSGVNICLNSDPGRIMALLSLVSLFFFAYLMGIFSENFFIKSRLSDPLNPGLGLNGVTSNCIRQTPLSPLSLRCKMHREHQKKRQCAPWTHCGQNPLLFHGMSFHVRFMCLRFFCNQRKFLCTPRQVLSNE